MEGEERRKEGCEAEECHKWVDLLLGEEQRHKGKVVEYYVVCCVVLVVSTCVLYQARFCSHCGFCFIYLFFLFFPVIFFPSIFAPFLLVFIVVHAFFFSIFFVSRLSFILSFLRLSRNYIHFSSIFFHFFVFIVFNLLLFLFFTLFHLVTFSFFGFSFPFTQFFVYHFNFLFFCDSSLILLHFLFESIVVQAFLPF